MVFVKWGNYPSCSQVRTWRLEMGKKVDVSQNKGGNILKIVFM